MINRRIFNTLFAGAAAFLGASRARAAANIISFYDSTGPLLHRYDLDIETMTLTARETITLPALVQYAWPHPSRKFLYVIASNTQPAIGPTGPVGADKNHYAMAFRVDPVTGALTVQGQPITLTDRPLHVSVDHSGAFLFITYNIPAHVTVHRLRTDGTIADQITQPADLDFGIFAHQTLVTPNNKTVIMVTRGNDATPTKPEDPGAIKVFGFDNGRLTQRQNVRPGNGLGFGPRHLDFHPTLPRVYVSLERQNKLFVYGLNADGELTPDPLYQRDTLGDPKATRPGMISGPIHVHPNGKTVYSCNRGSGTVDYNGEPVSNGGLNQVVVWGIDPRTGEPTALQRIDTQGFEPRTFVIDPAGKILIVANIGALAVREGTSVTHPPATLCLYRIAPDGTLSFVRKVDADTSVGIQFWCGLLTMA